MAGRTTKSILGRDRYISAKEAAQILNCSAQNVNRLVRSGQLTKKLGVRQTLVTYGNVVDVKHRRAEPKPNTASIHNEILNRLCELERRLALVEIRLGKKRLTVRDRPLSLLETSRIRDTLRQVHPEAFTQCR